MKKIILASQSPRRKQLLEWAEVDFDVITSSVEENWPIGMSLDEIPIHIARNKALDVKGSAAYGNYSMNTPIVAADTVVIIDEMILGKPASKEDAKYMLNTLSGRTHYVKTGVVILKDELEYSFIQTTEVFFHELTEQAIENYIDNYKPFDKAGSYAIQEWIGVVGIKKINGDFYNVMGLPISQVVRYLNSISW